MTTILAIIALVLIGIILIILEILFIPGLIVGIIGGLSIFGGVYLSYKNFGATIGHISLVTSIGLIILTIAMTLRSKTWNKFALHTNIDGNVDNPVEENQIKIGDTGVAVSRLAPMGTVMINGQIIEAKTENLYLEQETEIIVIKLEQNKVIVKPKN